MTTLITTLITTSITKRITIISGIIGAFLAAIALFAIPAFAAPQAQQTTLPDFTLNAQTVISVTVAITGGQVIVVPVDLTFIAANQAGQTDVTVVADVEQQAGIFIGVAPSRVTSATLELPLTAAQRAAASATPAARATNQPGGNQTGTHVANRNSNLRSGPGTDFPVVGRVEAGDTVNVVGQNADGSWLQIDNGNWIAEFLVDPIESNNQDNQDHNEEDATTEAETTPEAATTPDDEATTTPDVASNVENAVALAAYVQQIAAIGSEASGAVNTLNALIADPQPLSADWRNDVAAQLAALSGALDQYLALTPVPGYEDLHAQVTTVALSCESAVDYLVGGLQNPLTIDPAVASQSVQSCAAQANALADTVASLP